MPESFESFDEFRDRLNARILEADNASIKRMFALDSLTYRDGALDSKTKEMLGLVSSMVMRCDDCVAYHIKKCLELGVLRAEFFDIFSVALTVGGTIVIPHLRRAVDLLDKLEQDQANRKI
ncbi:carboxymuconolactone decarboxylase family protein [bacterium]|nr:carboxymuconolactone decarboxylase family protein [bacterium]